MIRKLHIYAGLCEISIDRIQGYMCETGMVECRMTRSGVEVRFRGDGDIDDGDKFGVFPHVHELSA